MRPSTYLINQTDLALLVLTELVLGINEDEAVLGGDLLTEGEELKSLGGAVVPVLLRHEASGDDSLGADHYRWRRARGTYIRRGRRSWWWE